jgi:hypothetical protein
MPAVFSCRPSGASSSMRSKRPATRGASALRSHMNSVTSCSMMRTWGRESDGWSRVDLRPRAELYVGHQHPAALAYPPGDHEANQTAAALLMPARHLRATGHPLGDPVKQAIERRRQVEHSRDEKREPVEASRVGGQQCIVRAVRAGSALLEVGKDPGE